MAANGSSALKGHSDSALPVVEAMLQHSDAALVFLDRDFNFVRVNRAYADACRRAEEDFPGHNHFEFYPHEENEAIFRRVRETGEPAHWTEKPFQFPDQPERGTTWWDWKLTPISGEEGVVGFVFALTDVTDRVVARQRVEQAARAAEEHALETDIILDSLHDVVLIYDQQCVVRRANATFRANHGFDPVGLSVDQIIARLHCRPVDGSPIVLLDQPTPRAARGESVKGLRFIVTLPDRSDAIVETSSRPLRNRQGTIVGSVTSWHDLTEQSRVEDALRQSEARFRLALRNAPVSVATQSRDLRFLWAFNQRTASPESVVGRTDSDVFSREDAEKLVAIKRRVLETNTEVREQIWLTRGDTETCLDVFVEPMRDGQGQVTGIGIATVDLTPMKKVERALQEADRRKDEFLAMLAHELRNPLAAISNAQQVLEHTHTNDAQVLRMRAVIGRQVRHLARMVDDLLDVARITQGKISLAKQELALGNCIEHAVAACRPMFDEDHHTLSVVLPTEPVVVDADAARIEQVIINLLSNSAKYTNPGGKIEIRLEVESAEAVVRVIDNGIGMDAQLCPKVFEPFVQAETSLSRSRGGLGVGLSLVQSLAHLHGGSVSASSAGLGLGSTFVLRLPLAPSRQPSPAVHERKTHEPGRATVLVVDDNQDAADSMADLVSLWGHRAEVAYDGWQALRLAEQAPPSLVLLDIGLPGLDGYEVAKRLRALPGMRGARIVALSGYMRDEEREELAGAGFDDYVVKPVDFQALETIVNETKRT